MTINELLRKFEKYTSKKVNTPQSANKYKNSIKGTLEFLGYNEDISLMDIAEIKNKYENLQNDFETDNQQTIDKLKSFYTSDYFLNDGWVRASLPHFIPFLESLHNEDDKGVSDAGFLQWFGPLVDALKKLGGSATPEAARKQIIADLKLPDDIVNETRGKLGNKKFDNEVAWARNYLAYEGYIDKSVRGVWTLTDKGMKVAMTRELASDIFFKWIEILKERREGVSDAEIPEREAHEKHFWIMSPGAGASKWDEFYTQSIIGIGFDFVGVGIGDLSSYSNREEIRAKMKSLGDDTKSYKMDSLALWQFFHDMQVGDVIFIKKGISEIIGRGIVESDYIYMPERDEYKHIRKMRWTHNGCWPHPGQAVLKTLTDITTYTYHNLH